MSDGVRIALDVYLPSLERQYPAVFYFGPYRKDDYIIKNGSVAGLPALYTERGYALVVADVRGTNDSEGNARQMFDLREQRDGYEVVEWIARQPWCDGCVGMTGISYGFFTSLLTAAQQPPHLRTVVPIHGGVSWYYAINEGGMPMSFGYHGNYVALMISMQGSPPGYRDTKGSWRDIWKHRLETLTPWGFEWFGHQVEDENWDAASICKSYEKIKIPVFAIDGWWDRYASDPLKICEGIESPIKILLGPWQHSRPDLAIPGPRVDYEVILRWFDHWLKDEQNGIMEEPPITFFRQRYGAPSDYRELIPGTWRQEERWPIARIELARWYLGAGSLSGEPPSKEGSYSYPYDPTAGVCSRLSGGIYGGIGMPVDQRHDEAKSLTFTSDALESDLEITGIPRVRLYFASSAQVMGVFAKLCDVAPDGTVALITRGYLNVAFRGGYNRPKELIPGVRYPLDIEMKATSYLFEARHRIRLTITSAEFPSVFPTPQPADNSVYWGGKERSHLELPTVPLATEAEPPLSLKVLATAPEQPPADRSFEVYEDAENRETRAVLNINERYPGLEGWIEHRQRTTSRVCSADPAKALVESESTFHFRYDSGEEIQSCGKVRYQGDSDSVQAEACLKVSATGSEEISKSWSATYPRKYV
jgi:putative CocE/NonD family hydrolase